MYLEKFKIVIPEKKHLKLSGFQCEGFAFITDWYCNKSYIKMDSFEVKNLDEIKDKINDGNFGSQSIDGAYVDIFPIYGNHIFYDEIIGIKEIGNIDDKLYNLLLKNEYGIEL